MLSANAGGKQQVTGRVGEVLYESHAAMLTRYNERMQTPVPREQVQLSASELQEFDTLAAQFERVEEHVLDASLMLYVNR